jgi:hypothetical protein
VYRTSCYQSESDHINATRLEDTETEGRFHSSTCFKGFAAKPLANLDLRPCCFEPRKTLRSQSHRTEYNSWTIDPFQILMPQGLHILKAISFRSLIDVFELDAIFEGSLSAVGPSAALFGVRIYSPSQVSRTPHAATQGAKPPGISSSTYTILRHDLGYGLSVTLHPKNSACHSIYLTHHENPSVK